MAVFFVEDIAAIDRSVWWCIYCAMLVYDQKLSRRGPTVQRNSVAARVRVGNAVQSQLVRHVRDLISLVGLLGDDLHMTILGLIKVDGWPCVPCLGKTAFEDLHDTVGVRMAMNCQ